MGVSPVTARSAYHTCTSENTSVIYAGCKSQVSMKAVYIGHSKGMVHVGKQWQ